MSLHKSVDRLLRQEKQLKKSGITPIFTVESLVKALEKKNA